MVKFTEKEAFEAAKFLIRKSKSWHELRAQLDDFDIADVLSGEKLLELSDLYQKSVLDGMSDVDLLKAIYFWAQGGTYKTHLDGFNAPSPRKLLDQVASRGGVVHRLESRTLVSFKDFPPLSLGNGILLG